MSCGVLWKGFPGVNGFERKQEIDRSDDLQVSVSLWKQPNQATSSPSTVCVEVHFGLLPAGVCESALRIVPSVAPSECEVCHVPFGHTSAHAQFFAWKRAPACSQQAFVKVRSGLLRAWCQVNVRFVTFLAVVSLVDPVAQWISSI